MEDTASMIFLPFIRLKPQISQNSGKIFPTSDLVVGYIESIDTNPIFIHTSCLCLIS